MLNSPEGQVLPEATRIQLLDKIQGHVLPVSLLVAGFDDVGEGHILKYRG